MKNRSREVNEQIKFGLDSINPEAKITIKLKDFMLVYKTLEEFNRFFHQKGHWENISQMEAFIGDIDTGAYSIIHKIYYDVLAKYIPKEIAEKFGQEDDPFKSPKAPFYLKK